MKGKTKAIGEYVSECRAYLSNVKGKYARLSSFISSRENTCDPSIVYGLRKIRARFMLYSWLYDSLNVSRKEMQISLSGACCANCDEHHLRAEIERVLDPARAFIEFNGIKTVGTPEFRDFFRREFGKDLEECLLDMELDKWKQATRRERTYSR